MSSLTENFAKAYPNFAPIEFKNECTIHESQNDRTSKLQEIKFTGISGYLFPHNTIAATQGFAQLAGHSDLMCKDCDGVFILDKDGKQYMVFCELKSSYIPEDIYKAQKQIIASYLKMRAVLGTLQGYDPSDYEVIGIIISFAPSNEELTRIAKSASEHKNFAIKLQQDKSYNISSGSSMRQHHPFNTAIDFPFHYAPVPNRKTEYTFNLASVLGI